MSVLPEIFSQEVDVGRHVTLLLIAGAIELPLVHVIQVLSRHTWLMRLSNLLNSTLRVTNQVEELVWENDGGRRFFSLLEGLKATIAAGCTSSTCVVLHSSRSFSGRAPC